MLASENPVCEGLSVTKKGEGREKEEGETTKKKIKNKKRHGGKKRKERQAKPTKIGIKFYSTA